MLHTVLRHVIRHGGHLTAANVDALAHVDRLRPILVRCNTCRLTCPAADVAHIVRLLTAGGEGVRDITLPASDPAYTGDYVSQFTADSILPSAAEIEARVDAWFEQPLES